MNKKSLNRLAAGIVISGLAFPAAQSALGAEAAEVLRGFAPERLQLPAAPEPEADAMLAAGFGLMVFVARRRLARTR